MLHDDHAIVARGSQTLLGGLARVLDAAGIRSTLLRPPGGRGG